LAEELDLGQITIEGEGQVFLDSTISISRFSEMNKITNPKVFQYDSAYFRTKITPPEKIDLTKKGYLYFRLGEYLFGSFRARYISEKYNFISFASKAIYSEYETNWNYRTVDFSWLPSWDKHHIKWQYRNQKNIWDSKFYQNDLESFYMNYQVADIKINSDLYLEDFYLQTQIGKFSYKFSEYVTENNDYNDEKYIQVLADATFSKNDYFIKIVLSEEANHNFLRCDFGKRNVEFSGIKIFDEISAQLWNDRNDEETFFMPSVAWFSRFHINSKLDFIFRNDPNIQFDFLDRIYQENPYQEYLISQDLHTKKIINLTTALTYDSFLPFTISANYVKYKNFYFWDEKNIRGIILKKTTLDVEDFELAAEIAYRFGYLHFYQEIRSYVGEKSDIHLQNKFTSVSKIDFVEKSWRLNFTFEYYNREIAKEFDDVLKKKLYMISMSESYDIKENLQIQGEIKNILNFDNRDYVFLPETAGEFNFTLGFKYTF
jgi:hypothetical protein